MVKNMELGAGTLAIIFLVAASAMAFRHLKKYADAMRKVAESLNFTYEKSWDMSSLNNYIGFDFYKNKKDLQFIKHIMSGSRNCVDITIFEFTHRKRRISSDESNHINQTQTVFVFKADGMDLPHFEMNPKGIFNKIGVIFGKQDITFQAHPLFSNKYVLRGDDEKLIRQVFDESVLSFFEKHTGLTVEGKNNTLIIYKRLQVIESHMISTYLDGYLNIQKIFMANE